MPAQGNGVDNPSEKLSPGGRFQMAIARATRLEMTTATTIATVPANSRMKSSSSAIGGDPRVVGSADS